jgi:hypothetical protein
MGSGESTSRGAGKGLRISFLRKVGSPVRIQIQRVSTTRSRTIKTTLIKRWRNKTRSFTWNGKPRRGVKVLPGIYPVRFQIRDADGRLDSRRVVIERKQNRFAKRPRYFLGDTCKP